MMMLRKLIEDERGASSPTVAIKGLVLTIFIFLLMFVLIDIFYLYTSYAYVKDQQDLANRAVYAALDATRLADRDIYIDESLGQQKFLEYIRKNLELNESYIPGRDIRIVGSVVVKNFEIYNKAEIPTITPSGKSVDMVSVYSEIEVEIKPFLYGMLGTVKINPHLTTDIPDRLVNMFHPAP